MKDKNLKYIAHAIIVVAFMGLIAFVIYYFFFSSLRRVDGRKWFQKKDY